MFSRSCILFCMTLGLLLSSVKPDEYSVSTSDMREKTIFSARDHIGRILGGDFTQLNSMINDLILNVSTAGLQPDNQEICFGFICADVVIKLGDGYCTNVQILPAGDLRLVSSFRDPQTLDDGELYETYEVIFQALAIDFVCYVEMDVDVFIGGLDFSNGGESDESRFGILQFQPANIVPVGGFLNASFDIFSKNFSISPPLISNYTGCVAQVNELDYSGTENLGSVLNGLVDVTPTVIDTARNDKSLVQEPVQDELCLLLSNVTEMIGEFFISNPITNVSLNNGTVLDAENSLNLTELNNSGVDLLDISDNILTNSIFTENGSMVDSAIESFYGTNGTIADVLEDFLGLNLTTETGQISINVLEVAELLFNETLDNVPLVNFSNNSIGNLILYVDEFYINATRLNIDFSSIEFPGKQTFQFPTIDFGNMNVFVQFRLLIDADEFDFGPVVLPPFSLDEIFKLEVSVLDLLIDLAGFVAVDLSRIPLLEFGGVTNKFIDCFLSTNIETPRIAGFDFSQSGITIRVSGLEDAIAFVVGDILNNVFPVVEGSIPLFLKSMVNSAIVNQELFDPATCPSANTTDSIYKYDFSVGIFKTISSIIDEDLANTLLEVIFPNDDDDGNMTAPDVEILEEAISFSFELPRGKQSTVVELEVKRLSIDGILPPFVRYLKVLYADENSKYFPQELSNELDIADEEQPITLLVDFSLNVRDAGEMQKRRLSDAPFEQQTNNVLITLSLADIQVALDILASMNKYDVESILLRDALNIDCWQSRLQRYGGILDLTLLLNSLDINIDCECDNKVLKSLSNSASTDSAASWFLDIFNTAADLLATTLENDYKGEERWNRTITNADLRCRGLEDLGRLATDEFEISYSFGNTDLAIILGGVLVASVNIAFVLRCCCLKKQNLSIPALKRTISQLSRSGRSGFINAKDPNSHTSLLRTPHLPIWVRFGIPFLILGNIGLFVAGNFSIALTTVIEAQIFEIPVEFDDFAQLSVISSTQSLIESKAYGLAIMVITLAIIWPYVKLLMLAFVWFAPPSILSVKLRTKVINWLDTLGKWSFVEFYFLIFVLVGFQANTGSPQAPFLPDDVDIFEVTLAFILENGIYTFAAAVMFSLILSNFVLVYNHRAVLQVGIQKKKIEKVEDFLNQQRRFSIASSYFANQNAQGEDDTFIQGTKFGMTLLAMLVTLSIMMILSLIWVPVFKTTFTGILAVVIESDGSQLTSEYSFEFLILYLFGSEPLSVKAKAQRAGLYFLGATLVLTVVIMPILQQLHLLYIFFSEKTLIEAKNAIQTNLLMSAWCCLEVYFLAIIVSAIEVTSVSYTLVEEECGFLAEPLAQLVQLELISEENAAATCFGVKGEILITAGVFLGTIFLSKFTTFLVLSVVEACSYDQDVDIDAQIGGRQMTYKTLLKLYLITAVDAETAEKREQEKAKHTPSYLKHYGIFNEPAAQRNNNNTPPPSNPQQTDRRPTFASNSSLHTASL